MAQQRVSEVLEEEAQGWGSKRKRRAGPWKGIGRDGEQGQCGQKEHNPDIRQRGAFWPCPFISLWSEIHQ